MKIKDLTKNLQELPKNKEDFYKVCYYVKAGSFYRKGKLLSYNMGHAESDW